MTGRDEGVNLNIFIMAIIDSNEVIQPITFLEKTASFTKRQIIMEKGVELEKIGSVIKTTRPKLKIEIESITATYFGCEVYVKAWDLNDTPIGFGKDGSIEIERIRLAMNQGLSFMYVKDPVGEVSISERNEKGIEVITKMRQDPKEALMRRLENVITDIGTVGSKIKVGTRGNTVTVIDITVSTSACMAIDANATWAGAHDAAVAGGRYVMIATGNANQLHSSLIGGTYYIRRNEERFDTSVIGAGQVVSGLTHTMYVNGSGCGDVDGYTVDFLDNTNNANIGTPSALEDYNDFGATPLISKDMTDYFNAGANVTTQDFGVYDVVDVTGTTRIGQRFSGDIADTAPTGSNVIRLDATGDNPYITVTHAVGGITINPAVQVATFSIPAYAAQTGLSITPAAQVATFSIPAYSIKTGVTISPTAQVATFSVPTYAVLAGDALISPSALVATFSVPAYAVKVGITVSPATQVATLSIPTYTITAKISVVVSVAVQVLTFSLPTLARVGGVWTKVSRATNSTWSRISRNSQ